MSGLAQPGRAELHGEAAERAEALRAVLSSHPQAPLRSSDINSVEASDA